MTTRRAVVALATGAAVALSTIGLAAGAAAENNKGTIKVADEAGCTEISNDPKIVDEFWVAGFSFAADESGTLTIVTQPGGASVASAGATADAEGNFCVGPFTVDEGQYKVTFVFTSASGKSKVFKVEVTQPADEPEEPPEDEPEEPPEEEEEPEVQPEETTPQATPAPTTTPKPSAEQQASTWTPISADVPQTGF